MRGLRNFVIVLSSVLCAAPMVAADSKFHPDRLKPNLKGAENQIAVLGTPHLSGWPKDFDVNVMADLLDHLARWKPQLIFVETLSGQQCAMLRQYPDRYADTVENYCWDNVSARKATGLDIPAATQAVDRLLADWPDAPTPAQRRHLAALFFASGDQASALVQWLRLPDNERRVGDGLDDILVKRLRMLQGWRSEEFLVAAPLAARLGLERVYPMDDHSADAFVSDGKAYGEALSKAWDNKASNKRAAKSAKLAAGIGTRSGVLALYRAYNAPSEARITYDSDFGAALVEPSPQQFGRNYLGYWETRNLRMAANIRDVFGLLPGKRGLVIVGASHKFYLDAYLSQMHDIHIVNVGQLLR